MVFHVSNCGYQYFYGSLWSEDPSNPSHLQSPLQWALCNTERPIIDTLTVLTLHNLFGRHPRLKVLSIENGSNWLKALLKTVDKAAALGRKGPMLGGPLPPRPSEALAEHLWVCPFPEDDVEELLEALGADHVLFGSDYPHPEGLRQPSDFIERLADCDPVTTRKVLPSNTAELLGLSAVNATALVTELARRFRSGDRDGPRAAPSELPNRATGVAAPRRLVRGREGMERMGQEFAPHWDRTIDEPRIFGGGGPVVQLTTQTWTANRRAARPPSMSSSCSRAPMASLPRSGFSSRTRTCSWAC